MIWRGAAIAAILCSVACGGKESCSTLAKEWALAGTGFVGEAYCRAELSRLTELSRPWGSIREWREQVFAQGVWIFFDMQRRIIERPDAAPFTFSAFPEAVPCGTGVKLPADDWQRSPLGHLKFEAPERSFFSFEVIQTAEKAEGVKVFLTFRMRQNHNCDQAVGVTESEGYARLGKSIYEPDTWRQTAFRKPQFLSE